MTAWKAKTSRENHLGVELKIDAVPELADDYKQIFLDYISKRKKEFKSI